jgi:TM2 domain-containing membrane protein YozV
MSQVPSTPPSGGGSMTPQEISSKKMTAGILAILVGGFGIHKFYLGNSTAGIIHIVATIVTCGAAGILGLIEGIIYLTKSDQDFYQQYIVANCSR